MEFYIHDQYYNNSCLSVLSVISKNLPYDTTSISTIIVAIGSIICRLSARLNSCPTCHFNVRLGDISAYWYGAGDVTLVFSELIMIAINVIAIQKYLSIWNNVIKGFLDAMTWLLKSCLGF